MEQTMGAAPIRVTAVVTAHDRREFLPAAVRSALDAGADELIVVRNFAGGIDGCEGEFRDIRCDAPETNEKEARGLESARGDVVGFLDDDDRWTATKVTQLREWFSAAPDLVYLNHSHRAIDAAGAPVGAAHPELADKDPRRFATWDRTDFPLLVRRIWPGNNSSTVVRKAWASEWLPAFREAGWSADLFWLVSAILSGRRLDIRADVLSELRLHDRNMSQTRGSSPAEFRLRHRVSSERFERSTGVLARLATTRAGPDDPMSRYLASRTEGYRWFARLEAGTRPRSAALRALRRGPGTTDRAVTGTALVGLVSPGLARRLLYRSSVRRWQLG